VEDADGCHRNSGTGIQDGPGLMRVDLSIAKLMTFRGPGVGSSLEFRAEFYNTLNPPQFANPEPNYSSALSRARL
jgi:hypothetical protein